VKKYFTFLMFCGFIASSMAGNPDRQGSAGAGELLMNPWARSAGLHTINTAGVTGIEATRLNIAGMARINSLEISYGHAQYLVGTDISMNTLGLAKKIGKNGVFGLDFMLVNVGDIKVTTVAYPEGTGATFTPTFANIGISYATVFENKVSVGAAVRLVMESFGGISARGVAIDAGVQYVNGPKDNFKLGLSLRNLGTPMKFRGEGFTVTKPSETGANTNLAYDQRSANFELPVALNIGTSYDFYVGDDIRVSPMVNFTSNSFSRDQLGFGVELGILDNMLQVRGAYKAELQKTTAIVKEDVYTGLALGASANLVFNKEKKSKIGFDYAYRTTNVFSGTHNFGVRIDM
jgi:hypothetical protein